MANKRIKDLSTTAAVTASDDFIAVDGATNGTRKLDAYSPTFGGNLTVSGTGLSSVAGALNVTGALLAHQTAALNMAHEGSSLSQLVSYGADASTYGRLNFTLRKAGTGVGAVTALALTSTDATLSGNLTVSGGTISSGTASLTLKSTASTVILQSAGTTALTIDTSQNSTFAGKTYTAAGAAATPAISFSGDTDSGFYNAGGNQVALACGGGQIWNTTVNGLSMASGKDIYLGNAYVAGAPTATGYVTIKDSAGNIYKVLVGT